MTDPGEIAAVQLRAFVERIERVNEQVAEWKDEKKLIYAEAKCGGFDPKFLKKVIAWRKKDPHVHEEEEAVFDLYLHALGMLGPDADPGAGPGSEA
ncbi:DUF2312 domain-containing protein [Roseibium sp. SCP14]|uniref:DUF2312 domain-containing protein n=1 Tax=Roseibium sp. SCP14 TaxID=3141375 RepID=UPI00333B7566